jgi:PAS domain S-box-containing protein
MERIHPEDRAPFEELLNRAARDRNDFEFEYRIVLPDSSIKFVRSVGRALVSPSGELEFIGTVMDITERKRAENEIRQLNASLERRVAERTTELVRSERLLRESEARLRESEQRFSRAFAASPALMTIARLSDGKFVEVNDSFARWFGLDRDGILGHDAWELGLWLNLDDRSKFWADLRVNASVREIECRLRTRRGTVQTVLVSADIVEVNREPHTLGFFLDITERKRVESELLRTVAREKELGQLRSNFVSMVSHEFRTPLGIIQSSAEILQDYPEQLEPAEREDICNRSVRIPAAWLRRWRKCSSSEVSMRARWNSSRRRWTCGHSREASRKMSSRQPTGGVRSNCRFPKCLPRSRLTSGCCDTFSRIC